MRYRQLYLLPIVALLISACSSVDQVFGCPIPDENLNAAVQEQLGTGNPSCLQVNGMTTLVADKREIASLEGLEYATNLEKLSLMGNGLSDLTPLASLPNLTTLALTANRISDLTPLSGLTALTGLDLGANRVEDLTPLIPLTNLSGLYLDGNLVSDLHPLIANTGFGSGATLRVHLNCLDSSDPRTAQDIITLKRLGVNVLYSYDQNRACRQARQGIM